MGKGMLATPLLSFLDDCAMLNNLEEYVIDLMSCSALAATPFLLLTMPDLTLITVAILSCTASESATVCCERCIIFVG